MTISFGTLKAMRSDIALGLVTLVTTILGGIVSAHAPARTWQKWLYGMTFVALGIVGLCFVVKQSNETTAATAILNNNISDLRGKLDSLGIEIKKELASLIPKHYERNAVENLALSEGAKAAVPAQSESQRRQAILQALRREYILSHDNLSPSLLAGMEWPPFDWLNQRLRELKEPWTVTAGPT
jgi:hypothetical protein